MSDQELSDIVTYIRSQPPVDEATQPPVLGPLGKVLLATGQLPVSADVLANLTDHLALPPVTDVSVDFGAPHRFTLHRVSRSGALGRPDSWWRSVLGTGAQSHAGRRRDGGMELRRLRGCAAGRAYVLTVRRCRCR